MTEQQRLLDRVTRPRKDFGMTAILPERMVLDACCGSRMFWFDRADERAVFMDNRAESHSWKDSAGNRRCLEIKPDIVGDFTQMEFEDNSFHLVVFDPPHRVDLTAGAWQAITYGKLPGNWRDVLQRGFTECFRVLRPNGILIFKWNDHKIAVKEVLALTPEKPLFGQRCGKTAKTHWIVFIKGNQK